MSLRVYPDRVVVAAEGQIICELVASLIVPMTGRATHVRLAALSGGRAAQARRSTQRAPLIELPEAFRTLQQYLLKKPGADREMVDILALVLQHDEQAVLSAVDMALKSRVPTKTHVLNLLHRLVDGKSSTPPTSKHLRR